MKIILAPAFACLLLIGACQTGRITPAETQVLGCSAYATALSTLATLNNQGKLSAGQVKMVDSTRAYLNPICLGDAPDVNATALDLAVDGGVKALNAIIAEETQ